MKTETKKDPRWQIVLARREGTFFYGVRSTGIFCRPTCASRRPKPENVRFFDTPDEAKAAGFRACKRCEPEGVPSSVNLVAQTCALIETRGGSVSRAELEDALSISYSQLTRVFKEALGMTPAQYGTEVRRQKLRDSLSSNVSVTRAAQDSGYTSTGHFYKDVEKAIAMTPKSFQKNGKNQTIRYTIVSCKLGLMLVAATERGICHLQLDDNPDELLERLKERFSRAEVIADSGYLEEWLEDILLATEEPKTLTHLPLDLQGTVFQKQVWHALLQIPPGETRSYSELAAGLGNPRATRAVARACASNEVSVIVPCHRVIGKNGKLTGFRWGLDRKQKLLEAESN